MGVGGNLLPLLCLIQYSLGITGGVTWAGECSRAVDGDTVPEIVVEVHPWMDTLNSDGPAGMPFERAGWSPMLSLMWSTEFDSFEGLEMRMWVGCKSIGAYNEVVPIDNTDQVQQFLLFSNPAWLGGHENSLLAQLWNLSTGRVVAQGGCHFAVLDASNSTEGALERLSQTAGSPQGAPAQVCLQGEKKPAKKGREPEDCVGEASSSVTLVDWDGFDCAVPRHPLRLYRVTSVQWSSPHLHVFMPGQGASQEGLLKFVDSRPPAVDECTRGGLIPGRQWADGYLLPGLSTGTVEHFGHFMVDYVMNVWRAMKAEGYGDAGDWDAVLLVDDRVAKMDGALPKRAFHALLAALSKHKWVSLGGLPDGTCFRRLVIGYGALENIRSQDAASVPDKIFQAKCSRVYIGFQSRVRLFMATRRQHTRGKLLYMSRGSASWRKLVGETEILDRWNRDHKGEDSLNVFRPEGLSFAEQLQQIAGARALVGVNGAQILSCLFLPTGSTCAVIFLWRWSDSNFVWPMRGWLQHAGCRYLQVEAAPWGPDGAIMTSGNVLQKVRDADVKMEYEDFEDFVSEAAAKWDIKDVELNKYEVDEVEAVEELRHLLLHLETEVGAKTRHGIT